MSESKLLLEVEMEEVMVEEVVEERRWGPVGHPLCRIVSILYN